MHLWTVIQKLIKFTHSLLLSAPTVHKKDRFQENTISQLQANESNINTASSQDIDISRDNGD